MDDGLKQALQDFELFLAGSRAPALIGHSLATVVGHDVRVVADAVVRWAYRQQDPLRNQAEILLGARNKVFDVFFYRVVRFQRIYEFFPPFERSIVRACPVEHQKGVADLFQRHPWKEIRPLGSFRDPAEFALEQRKEASVHVDEFNEDLYKNATHQILAADRRYTFDSDAQQETIGKYTQQVGEIFDDFVHLIPDAEQKREIQMANAADKDAVYQKKPRFQIEGYICQLADLSIALHNDDFFEHGIKVCGVIHQLAADNNIKLPSVHRLQEKTDLINQQKLSENGSTKTGTFLMRDMLTMFNRFTPERLLQWLYEGQDRRERKLALIMLESYGRDAYELLVQSLESLPQDSQWYFPRNLMFLLGRIPTNDEEIKHRVANVVARFIQPKAARQLNLQAIATLGFLSNDTAIKYLLAKLTEFGQSFGKDREATDTCHKIASTLIGTENEAALEAALQFCESHELLDQYREHFSRVNLPPRMRSHVISRIRKEIKKLKMTFSIVGDPQLAKELVGVVGNGGDPEVGQLLTDVINAFPARSEIHMAAQRAKQTPAPQPLLAPDRTLHRLLTARDIPQAFCHIYEAGLSGKIAIETKESISAEVEIVAGKAMHASVPAYFLEGDNAFAWTLLIEGRDIQTMQFSQSEAMPRPTVNSPTNELLKEALFQRGQVETILGRVLSPDAKYVKRQVNEYYTRFDRVEHPNKYRAVWDAIDDASDVGALQVRTKLNRYEVCKILFYMIRQNMVAVDTAQREEQAMTLDDALMSIALCVKQIEEKPVNFNLYYSAAEACAYLRQHLPDETIRGAARGLRNFFIDAYGAHRVLVAKHIELCKMTLNLMGRYMKTRFEQDQRELIDFVAFSFAEVINLPDTEATKPKRSTLEKLENIEAANDAFDQVTGLFDDLDVDELLGDFGDTLEKSSAPPKEAVLAGGLTPGEEEMLLELFGNIANAYVKPFKDFVRELQLNHKAEKPTTADWLDFALPSVNLLSGAADKMGYMKLHSMLSRIEQAMVQQKAQSTEGDALPKLFCERMLVEHIQLAKTLPSTFSLEISDEELESRKEGLIVKFILKQLPQVDDRVINKIIFAGLGAFDRFMEIPSDEIAHVTGIPQQLAETIYMKFYQYRDLYYNHTQPSTNKKLVSLFEISLSILREIHSEVENVAKLERLGRDVDQTRKQGLLADRQRTLWSLFALLCIKGEHDLIEQLQMSVFEERVHLLDEYFARLAGSTSRVAA